MKIEKLQGHSGCDLFLFKDNNNSFVRKISPNKEYNSRLLEQCNKQIAWDSDIASVPAVIESGYEDGLFYFDMEYILGGTVSSMLTENQIHIDEVIEFVLLHYKIQYTEKQKSNLVINSYFEKIEQLNALKNKYPLMKNLHQALELLSNNFRAPQYITKVHGDMTLENLVKSKKDNKIYMIDFLDDFSNGLYTDLSKIFQDILGFWSFFDKTNDDPMSTQSNLSVRMYKMRKKIISGIKKIDNNDRILENILYVLLMNYIRIIPYIQHNHVYSYIDQKLEETMGLILNDNLTSGYNEKNNIKMVS